MRKRMTGSVARNRYMSGRESAHGSAHSFRFERAYYCPCVHDVRRIEGSLDAAHRGDTAGVSVFLQEMSLETTDAMLCTERTPERRSRVVQPERQTAFD